MVDSLLSYAAAFFPVIFFLAALRMMDSYKLVPPNRIAVALAYGVSAAGISYLINTLAFRVFPAEGFTWFGAPLVEEFAKAGYWIFLIATARVAFMVDAGICAFAVGAGFALAENTFYLQGLDVSGVAVSILRGFGTGLMHGGVGAIAAMVTVYISERWRWRGPTLFLPGLLAAIMIHSLFNQGVLTPLASTIAMLLIMPLLLVGVFVWSEGAMRSWLGDKLDRDIEVLNMIATGELHSSRAGLYLQSLQHAFPADIRADMLCMMQLTIELSARAKGELLVREAGLEMPPDPEIDAQFRELAYLRKSIGPTGLLAVAPLLSQTARELWEMRRLAAAKL